MLRGHDDSGRISLKEPKTNDDYLRCLLLYYAKNDENVLKEHLETSGCNLCIQAHLYKIK